MHAHGPDNAEHEVKKAYNCIIEMGVAYRWHREGNGEVSSGRNIRPEEAEQMYFRAYDALRDGDRPGAERWARSVKHLCRARYHEAKISYLENRTSLFPFLANAQEEYGLRERIDTTADLLVSVAGHAPTGQDESTEEIHKYLTRARRHSEELNRADLKHELLRAEHLQAAHEYGRVVECMELAYAADHQHRQRNIA